MEQVLHLFITNKCRHNCELCCNKFYDIEKIPVVTVDLLKSVETVCLTGGEPFGIDADLFEPFVERLRNQYPNIKNLYVYTSGYEIGERTAVASRLTSSRIRKLVNGINIAPKDFKDWVGFQKLLNAYPDVFDEESSNRLYVFKEMKPVFESMHLDLSKRNINIIYRKWMKTFNTPDNEHFARLPILF